VCDIDQETDGAIVFDNHVRTTRYDSRAALAVLKQVQCFADIGRAKKSLDAFEHV
jgi:hypothetical protein